MEQDSSRRPSTGGKKGVKQNPEEPKSEKRGNTDGLGHWLDAGAATEGGDGEDDGILHLGHQGL